MKTNQKIFGLLSRTLLLAVVAGVWPSLALGAVGESVDKGVVRFHASAEARDDTLPSLCLVAPLVTSDPVPGGWEMMPEFNRVQGRTSVFLAIDEGTDL